ncbi:hypothetical protein YIM1640_22650 [Thermus oshimai]|jgi:putative transposase
MQLTTVGQAVGRGARLAQRLEEAGAGDPEVQERLCKLRLVQSLRKHRMDWREVQELSGISRATYYRWKKALEEEGLRGLKPRPRRPKRPRGKVHWSPAVPVRIEALCKANPTWGRWPIWLALVKEGYTLSERTVGRILAYLEGQGRVEGVASFLARSLRGKARRGLRRPYGRRRPKGYEVRGPGDLVQVDTLTVTLGPGEVVKHFAAVDLYSRFSLAQVHRRATGERAAVFLRALVAGCPFPVRAVQVDGGSEFMGEFEGACRGLGIRWFVLPPRSPELNGHVERMGRTFRDLLQRAGAFPVGETDLRKQEAAPGAWGSCTFGVPG